jgi:hypothetical protein
MEAMDIPLISTLSKNSMMMDISIKTPALTNAAPIPPTEI